MLSKFYSMDECSDHDKVFNHLDKLTTDGKISYEEIDLDIIRIKDEGLNSKEKKDLVKFLESHDVIDYNDLEDDDDFDDEDDLSDYNSLDDDDLF